MSAKNTLSSQLRHWFPQGRDQDIPYEALADKIIEAIDAAGFAIVPKEPTDEMKQAAADNSKRTDVYEADSVWRDMIKAATKPQPL